MVGDDFEVDIVGARNAGIDQVFYTPQGDEGSFAPTYQIRDLIELKRLLYASAGKLTTMFEYLATTTILLAATSESSAATSGYFKV